MDHASDTAPGAFASLHFAHLHKRLTMYVSLLKFLRNSAGRAAVGFGRIQGFSNPSDTQTLLEQLLVSYSGTHCENTGSAGPQPRMPSLMDPSPPWRDVSAGLVAELPLPSPLLPVFWPWSPLLESLH